MELSLKGRSAFVCGSTDGIGKAIALEIAELGANVTLIARNEEKLKKTLAELSNDSQVHRYIVADFSEPEKLKTQVDQYLIDNEAPEILLNNTGGPAPGALIDEDYSKFESTFSAHIQCNHILAQALVPNMKKTGYGRIINVISTSVYMPIPGLGVSNTTRAAVAGWAKTLSIELGQYGITVNNVLPGLTSTGRLDKLIESRAKSAKVTIKEMEDLLNVDTPAGRFGEAKEVAAMAAFLATPAASYINGVSIPVDGGRTGCI